MAHHGLADGGRPSLTRPGHPGAKAPSPSRTGTRAQASSWVATAVSSAQPSAVSSRPERPTATTRARSAVPSQAARPTARRNAVTPDASWSLSPAPAPRSWPVRCCPRRTACPTRPPPRERPTGGRVPDWRAGADQSRSFRVGCWVERLPKESLRMWAWPQPGQLPSGPTAAGRHFRRQAGHLNQGTPIPRSGVILIQTPSRHLFNC